MRHITEYNWQAVQRIWDDANASPYAQYDRPHNMDSADVRSRVARWAEASIGTAIDNTPSVRLLSSLGFRLTREEKVSFYKDHAGNDIVFDGGVYERTL